MYKFREIIRTPCSAAWISAAAASISWSESANCVEDAKGSDTTTPPPPPPPNPARPSYPPVAPARPSYPPVAPPPSPPARPIYPPVAYKRETTDGTEGNTSSLRRVELRDFLFDIALPQHKVVLIGETHDDHTAHVLEQLIVGHLKPAALTLEMAESRTADMEAACQAGEVEHGLHLARKEESGGGGSGADNGGGDGGWGGSGGYDAVGGALDLDDPARMIAPGWDRHVYGTLARIPRSYGGRCVAANPPRAHVSIARRAGVDGLRQLPADEQYLLPPLDSSLHLLPHGTAYRNALLEVFGAMKEPEGMMRAQGLWDAVQAWTILRTLAEEQLRVAATEADSNAAGGGEGKGDSEMHPHAKHAAAEHGTSPQVVHVCGMFHISHFGGVVEQMKHYLSHPASHFNTLELDLASEAVVVVILPGSPPPPPAERDDGTFADDVLSWADDLAKDVQVQGMADYVIFSPAIHEPEPTSVPASKSSAAVNGGCAF